MWAGTVAAPGAAISALAWSTIPRSMSVAVRATRSPFASTSTLLRIGMVLRRSTTLCTWPRDFSNAVRSIVSFMILATPSQIFGDRLAEAGIKGSGRSDRCLFFLAGVPGEARQIGPNHRAFAASLGLYQDRREATAKSAADSGPERPIGRSGRGFFALVGPRPCVSQGSAAGLMPAPPTSASIRPQEAWRRRSAVQHAAQQIDILGKAAIGG